MFTRTAVFSMRRIQVRGERLYLLRRQGGMQSIPEVLHFGGFILVRGEVEGVNLGLLRYVSTTPRSSLASVLKHYHVVW